MTAQQEASVADERVEAIAAILRTRECVGNSMRDVAREVAALWPAPAEDEALPANWRSAIEKIRRGLGAGGWGRHAQAEIEVGGIVLDAISDELEALEAKPAEDEVADLRYVPDIVKNAMLEAWNEICVDTECHPLDIEHGKRRHLTFTPRHWAQAAGEIVKVQIGELFVIASASARQPKPAHDAEAEKIDRVIQLLQQGVRDDTISSSLARTAIGILMMEPSAPPTTHDAEVADAAVRRCIEAIRTDPRCGPIVYELCLGPLRALLSEPSNG